MREVVCDKCGKGGGTLVRMTPKGIRPKRYIHKECPREVRRIGNVFVW